MEPRNARNKITQLRSFSWLNIGTILFIGISIYIIISLAAYLTARHVTSYEVTAGSISGNYRYTALAIKNETVFSAASSGYVTYYARNGARAAAGTVVCTVDKTPPGTRTAGTAELTDDDYESLRQSMSSFSLNFSDDTFQSVYNFKADLESYLLQAGQKSAEFSGSSVNTSSIPSSGFVCYTVDNMEAVTEADLSPELFNQKSYMPVNLRLSESVKTGDRLYKLISGEDWALYFPITSDLATELHDRTSIRFRFLKDDTTFSAAFSIIRSGDDYYGKLTLYNSLVRYVADRFLDIELLLDRKSGLKIPASAIGEKQFYRIPGEYVIVNSDNSNEIMLLRESFGSDGSSTVKSITATVYDKQGEDYLVDTSLFEPGDYVRMTNTTKKRQIKDSDLVQIQGVYNINKGYAIFRQVTVIDQNEEFCIVEPNSSYGLAAHDYIALDAGSIGDDDII